MKRTLVITTVLACATAMLLTPLSAAACPGCAESLTNELGAGFNASILFMMATPFTVVGVIGLSIFLIFRRAQTENQRNHANQVHN